MTRHDSATEERQFVQFASEADADSIGIRLIELFADIEECDPTELSPLQETVDGDALETVLTNASEDRYFSIEFEYNDSIVSITNEGRISIQPLHR